MVNKPEENIKKLEKNFILNTEYSNILNQITTTCKICGYKSTRSARTFLRCGCQNCKNIKREKELKERLLLEDEEYLDKVNNENNNEYRIIRYRKKEKDSIELEHIPCGTKTVIDNRNIKIVCNKCHPEKLIDADWYRERYPQMVEDGYEVLDVIYGHRNKSRGRSTNILIKHLECGNEYKRNNATLKLPDGYKCPFCVDNKKLKYFDDKALDFRIKSILGDGYEYAYGFTTTRDSFYIRHISCGNVYRTRVSSLNLGYGKCPKCKE